MTSYVMDPLPDTVKVLRNDGEHQMLQTKLAGIRSAINNHTIEKISLSDRFAFIARGYNVTVPTKAIGFLPPPKTDDWLSKQKVSLVLRTESSSVSSSSSHSNQDINGNYRHSNGYGKVPNGYRHEKRMYDDGRGGFGGYNRKY